MSLPAACYSGRHDRRRLAHQRTNDAQPAKASALGQALGLQHVFIEPAQLKFDGIAAIVVRLDTGVGKNGPQLPQRSPDLMPAALHWVRAGALRQMLIQEAIGVAAKMAKVESAPSRPPCEVSDATKVHAHRTGGLAPLNQVAPIRRHECPPRQNTCRPDRT